MNAASLSELNAIFEEIFKETGTEVRLTSLGGEETAFPVSLHGETVTAYLRGQGQAAQDKIKFVKYLVEGPLLNKQQSGGLKEVLLGEGGEWAAFRYIAKHGIKDGKCFSADVVPGKRFDESLKHIEHITEGTGDRVVRMSENRFAVVKFSSEDQTPLEYAQFLFQALYEEIGVKASVGVGCEAESFAQIASSYSQAVTAVKLSGIFHSKGEVHSYREYLLVTMLSEVPQAKLKEYVAQFGIAGAEELFSDPELTGTAEEFLGNNLNLSETARSTFVHRNTLTYRLDKIRRVTGLDLRNFSDAVTYRVISVLNKILK